jgi:hypothetical protein
MKVVAQRREIKGMSACRPDRAGDQIYPTRIMKRDPHTTKVGFANYTEPTREFNALWKSYEDLSRAATASSLLKPITVNCLTASTSSVSAEEFS